MACLQVFDENDVPFNTTPPEKIICGTGHRPPRLGLSYASGDEEFLENFAMVCLLDRLPTKVLSGMAQGWDMALAKAAVALKIPFVACIPFEGQEKKWPQSSQLRYQNLLDKAEKSVIVCTGGYAASKFWLRDKYMVDNSDMVLALFDGEPVGGTWLTSDYASKQGKSVINVWGAFDVARLQRDS